MSAATPTLSEVIRRAIDARMIQVNTSIPAVVQSYDPVKQRVDVQPLIRRGYLDEAGARQVEDLPIIPDVPVAFPGGGGHRITFPLVKGDTVMLIFSQASIDKWTDQGGVGDPIDDRRHSLSDAVAYPGVRDFKNPYSSAPTTSMSIGNDNGGPTIEITATEIQVGGTASLATKADVDALADMVDGHTHSGVSTGGGTSGPQVQSVPSAAGTSVTKGS